MEETDAHLVERARTGEGEAFAELTRRHFRSAYATALAILMEPHDAEDVAQDALIRALERLEQCRDPDRFGAWLRQIARNRALNVRRARTVRRVFSLRGALQVPSTESPARDAAVGELRERLIQALEGVTEVQREVVLLHDLEGWRHREIAEMLNLPEGTVRSHLSHARRKLRELLGPDGSLEE